MLLVCVRHRLCSRSCPASEHNIRPPVWELIWSCFEYWTRNKEWGTWMMKGFFRHRFCPRSRPASEHTIRPLAWELIWGCLEPKFRIRKCGITETAVIQSIEFMDWKHLLSGITLIKSLVRYMRNFYWLIRVEYWTRNKEWGSWMMKEDFSLSFVSLQTMISHLSVFSELRSFYLKCLNEFNS